MKFYTIEEIIKENPKSILKVNQSKSHGKYVFYTSGAKTKFYDNFICDGMNIFIATGGKANISFFDGKASYSTDCYSITTKPFVNPKFLFYFLQSKIKEINVDMFKGAALKHLQKKQFKNIRIKIPSLSEQLDIVAKLDLSFAEIDMAIDLDEQRLLKIDLFKAAVLKNEFDTSSKKIKLKNLVVYDRQQGEGSNLPYVGMENISSETMQIIGDIIVPEKTSSTFKFNNTHVLFGRLRPYLKKVLIPNFKGQCSTEIFCLKPSEKINKLFLAYWLLSPSISHKINKSSTGARMPRANMNELLNYDFPDFSFSKQQQIVNRIDTAFTLIENFKKKLLKKISNFKSLKLSIISQKLKNKAA